MGRFDYRTSTRQESWVERLEHLLDDRLGKIAPLPIRADPVLVPVEADARRGRAE